MSTSSHLKEPVDSKDDSIPGEVTTGQDEQLEKRVWLKLDLYLLPVVAMFYLLSFLDRTNVGNARIAGLQADLHMSNYQYSIALTTTYVPYIAAELPSNLLLKILGPNYMLPTMLSLWGVVTTLQGVVTSYSGLLACRFFLGLLEGGVFPGLVLYLSMFYPRSKMNLRVSTFFASASVSGAFSGILAYGIVHIRSPTSSLKFSSPSDPTIIAPWRWIFIIEGLFTVAFGLASYFILPRSPETARFFNREESQHVLKRLKEETGDTKMAEEGFNGRDVLRAFTMPHVLFLAIIFFTSGVTLFGLAFFTPSIVQGLGYAGSTAQLMTVPPYAAAFVVAIICAYISDRYSCRGIITIVNAIMCIIGFSMYLASYKKSVQYGSLFFSISGVYSLAPTISAWSSNNAAPHTTKATAIAIAFIMSNSGGILATWLFGAISPGPRYTGATITALAMSCVMVLAAGVNIAYLHMKNQAKDRVRQTMTREEEELAWTRPDSIGDRSAWFKYNL